jgi:hypothetical protein
MYCLQENISMKFGIRFFFYTKRNRENCVCSKIDPPKSPSCMKLGTDSSVGIVMGCELNAQGSILFRGMIFFSTPQHSHIRSPPNLLSG